MKLKQALSGVVVAALAAIAVPLMTATPASAAGSLQGPATISTQSGDSNTNWNLTLPAGAACTGDSASGGYRVQSYMVPASVDPSTLQFGSGGPTPSGLGGSFAQPLFDTASNPYANVQTANASTAGGPGPILPPPSFNFKQFVPGNIPAGVYNLGIACTLGGASTTQMSNFWNVQMTVTTSASDTGPAGITWQNGTVPTVPAITTLTPGAVVAATGQISVAFTTPPANPALTSCTLFVGTSAGGTQFSGAGGQSGSCTSPRVVTGLTYGQQYFIRMTSTNAVGSSPVSNELSSTPVRPAVANLTATPTPNTVSLSWTAAPLIAGGEQYSVDVCTGAVSPCLPASAGHVSTNPVAQSATPGFVFTGTAGQPYSFTVTYGAAGTSLPATVGSTPLSNAILIQDITVGRPNGALVLTQVCGKWDAMPAEGAQIGFPGAGLPASPASATGTAPTTGATPGGPADPAFSQYPYPTLPDGTANPTYPTHCGIALGNAQFVSQGGAGNLGAGQYFAASGRLNQVTVVDTRDTDQGWNVNFAMSDFTSGTNSFSGNDVGWSAQKTQTPTFTDGSGVSYSQLVTFGTQTLAPATQSPNGAKTSQTVIKAAAGSGLGIATLDGRIKVLIPVYAKNGTYAATLTINAL